MIVLLSLPSDILKLIMSHLNLLHSPKPLMRFLLSTQQLCARDCMLYKTLVVPFLRAYVSGLKPTMDRLRDTPAGRWDHMPCIRKFMQLQDQHNHIVHFLRTRSQPRRSPRLQAANRAAAERASNYRRDQLSREREQL